MCRHNRGLECNVKSKTLSAGETPWASASAPRSQGEGACPAPALLGTAPASGCVAGVGISLCCAVVGAGSGTPLWRLEVARALLWDSSHLSFAEGWGARDPGLSPHSFSDQQPLVWESGLPMHSYGVRICRMHVSSLVEHVFDGVDGKLTTWFGDSVTPERSVLRMSVKRTQRPEGRQPVLDSPQQPMLASPEPGGQTHRSSFALWGRKRRGVP